MSQFVPISAAELQAIVKDGQAQDPPAMTRVPPEYYTPFGPIRMAFWQRLQMIHALIKKYTPQGTSCLDFGSGGGMFAPTLATCFPQVTLLDLDTSEAQFVCDRYQLKNVTCQSADATKIDLGAGRFDAIIAADVLEHFYSLDDAITPIKRWLADDGVLFTSLPTENLTYEMLRLVFRTQKPEDHYHKAYEVEAHLESRGFKRIKRRYAPLYSPIFPLFYISAWRKA